MNDNIHARATADKSHAFTIKTFRDRDDWVKLVLAAEGDTLSAPARNVAIRIAFHHNVETGQCNPSVAQIAAGSGMSDRNVRRMLREIEQAGWMVVNQSSGGRRSSKTYNSNSFELRVPLTRTNVSELNPDTVVRDKEPNPDKPGRLTRTNGAANPDTVVRRKENLTANKNSEVESDSQLDLGDKKEGRRGRNPKSESKTKTGAESEIGAAFKSFWRQVIHKESKKEAEKLYRRIIQREEATPDQLMAAMLRFNAAMAGREPRYIKRPLRWLHEGCWADEPAKPIGTTIDGNGNPVRPPPPPNGHLSNLERVLMEGGDL